MHEAGRAFDLDLGKIKSIGLKDFWDIAKAEGVVPIISKPDAKLSEAWHFECRGSHQLVYDYYAAGKGNNFARPATAMAASAIVSVGVPVDAFGGNNIAAFIQSGLVRLGHNIGNIDGGVGPKTRAGLKALSIDDSLPLEEIAEAMDKKLQAAFPGEYFVSGVPIAGLENDVPEHIVG